MTCLFQRDFMYYGIKTKQNYNTYIIIHKYQQKKMNSFEYK